MPNPCLVKELTFGYRNHLLLPDLEHPFKGNTQPLETFMTNIPLVWILIKLVYEKHWPKLCLLFHIDYGPRPNGLLLSTAVPVTLSEMQPLLVNWRNPYSSTVLHSINWRFALFETTETRIICLACEITFTRFRPLNRVISKTCCTFFSCLRCVCTI